jgi:signal transduction histidine kinase
MKAPSTTRMLYSFALLAAGLAGVALSWTAFGRQLDTYAYDFVFRLYRPPYWQTESAILAIDEASLKAFGGIRGVRHALAAGLDLIRPAGPRAVAVDVILSDAADEASDAELEAAFRQTPNLVLAADLLPNGSGWEDPIPRFARWAAAIGHVHAELDRMDGVSREVPLERATTRDRHWALALEAFRVSRHATIVETPRDLEVAGVTIPSAIATGRDLRIRYVPPGMPPIPRVSIEQLRTDPLLARQFAGKVVFVGETAQTDVHDRLVTPYSGGEQMAGIEIHANAYETIAHRLFLTEASNGVVLLWCALLVTAAGLSFRYATGWRANVLALLLLAGAHVMPYLAFTRGVVFPFMPGVSALWLAIVTSAFWRHFVTRRYLKTSEEQRSRYQEAMHFVTHEMRTPLTAIQGSSELLGRYALPEAKRTQMAAMINAESKRLASMIQTFLNVERLTAGEMQLQRGTFAPDELVAACVARVLPLAQNKDISINSAGTAPGNISGDRELLEYAVYNLLTNAVKYSPPHTHVEVTSEARGNSLRVSVKDQGIGMDRQESKRVFEKFYRTEKAERSGEIGTGIGLSIVQQIARQHGGSVAVESAPGIGSTFTLVLPRNSG